MSRKRASGPPPLGESLPAGLGLVFPAVPTNAAIKRVQLGHIQGLGFALA